MSQDKKFTNKKTNPDYPSCFPYPQNKIKHFNSIKKTVHCPSTKPNEHHISAPKSSTKLQEIVMEDSVTKRQEKDHPPSLKTTNFNVKWINKATHIQCKTTTSFMSQSRLNKL